VGSTVGCLAFWKDLREARRLRIGTLSLISLEVIPSAINYEQLISILKPSLLAITVAARTKA
jgi:hypothetical protein